MNWLRVIRKSIFYWLTEGDFKETKKEIKSGLNRQEKKRLQMAELVDKTRKQFFDLERRVRKLEEKK